MSAKVFISHSASDTDTAVSLAYELRELALEAWTYEEDMSVGDRISQETEARIANCDHFIILLSDASRESPWVSRELGLAIKLREEDGRPTLLPVTCEARLSSMQFTPRLFHSGDQLQPIDFQDIHWFRYDPSGKGESVADLAEALRPRISFVEGGGHERESLLSMGLECYEALFPDEGEDSPADIETWLEQVWLLGPHRTPWREVFGVMHFRHCAIGVAYFSAHVDRHWCFGNYFGLRRGFRHTERVRVFYTEVRDHILTEIDPRCQGLLFEVEPVDWDRLDLVAQAGAIPKDETRTEVLSDIRSLRRLHLFQTSGALAFLGEDDRPLPYRFPAMSEETRQAEETQLILMVMPWQKEAGQIDIREAIAFVYDDLYGDAYGSPSSTEIPGFRPYVEGIKRDVLSAASGGASLGAVCTKPRIRTVLHLARKEGLGHLIDL